MKKEIKPDYERINKAKENIKKEKMKIKQEKRKAKAEKRAKFYNTKFGKFIKKTFKINVNNEDKPITLKEQIFSMIYFELMGVILCLLVLFALSGGKNYLKLYKDLNKLINVYDTIISEYYGQIDKEELIDDTIEYMIDSIGDAHTTYTDEETTTGIMESLGGTYEGIGCMVAVNQEGEIYVVNVFQNGPAEKAGLRENDIILKIDGEDYKGKTSEDMANYVKESNNTKVKLTIRREEKEIELTVVREKVETPTVTSEILEKEKKIGYINISIFSSVTYKQFKDELEKLEAQKIEGLIIDVRGDNGGYLSAVTDISQLFLAKGKVIYQLQDDKKIEKIKDETKEHRTYPVAVLINGGSASASEILAATIKESYNGFVVGTTSYGKGTVQKTKQLGDGSMFKYTVQKWLTPNGNWINEIGVEPTDIVDRDYSAKEDNQIGTAASLIIERLKK